MNPPAALYPELLELATRRPLSQFFANLHAALARYIDASVMVAAVSQPGTKSGFTVCYEHDSDGQAALLPPIEPREVQRALEVGQPVAARPRLIVAPMVCDSKAVGYLAVGATQCEAYGGAALRAVAAAADVAALAARTQAAARDAQTNREQFDALLETARAFSMECDLEERFQRFYEVVRERMEAPVFCVALPAERGDMTMRFELLHGKRVRNAHPFPKEGSLWGHVFDMGEPLLMRNAVDFQRFRFTTDPLRPAAGSGLAVPMRLAGRAIGVLSVQSERDDAYDEHDRELLLALAEQAAAAVESSQIAARCGQQILELQLIARMSRALSTQLSLRALCQTVCREVRRVMDAPLFCVWLLTQDGTALRSEYRLHYDRELDADDQPLRGALLERAMDLGQPLVRNSLTQEERQTLTSGDDGFSVQSVTMAPLGAGAQCLGVIAALSFRPGAYDESSARLLGAIAEQMTAAVRNARLFGEAQSRAERDPLTNLFHHRHLTTRLSAELERARAGNYSVAVLMIDIDDFKAVNDTYGHPAGDAALKQLADVLRETCRRQDVIGRYGGDEFMVILPESRREQAQQVVERVRAAVAKRELRIDDRTAVVLGCSIGVGVFPENGSTAAEVVAQADARLYDDKHRRRKLMRVKRPVSLAVPLRRAGP